MFLKLYLKVIYAFEVIKARMNELLMQLKYNPYIKIDKM